MAERRMFAKSIIDSDAFLELPISTQALYFHLAMRADDDGFVNKPRAIMNMLGAKNDDMKSLIERKFVITFDSGVVVIKHWRIHNYIQKDRYKETKYKFEKASLYLDENGSYSQNEQFPDRIQAVSETDAQDRSESGKSKDSSGKESIGEGDAKGGPDPERLKHFRFRVNFYRQQGWNPTSMYALALKEGITKEMIDEGSEEGDGS